MNTGRPLKISSKVILFFIIIFLVLFCLRLGFRIIIGASSRLEVKQFIQNTMTRKPKPVQPLPDFKTFERFQYAAQNLRNPLEIFVNSIAQKPPPTLQGDDFDQNRPRELLESYP